MFARPLSLLVAGRILVLSVFLFAGVVGVASWVVLDQIERDAISIQDRQIPQVLEQNRNALKIEKLVSYARSAFLARDSASEREILLQTRLLSQSFSLDTDAELTAGAAAMAAGIASIIKARAAERLPEGGDGMLSPASPAALDAYDRTIALGQDLAARLSTGTARVADQISTDIRASAARVRQAWLAMLAIPLAATMALFWFFRAQVVRPIEDAVTHLARIRERRFDLAPVAPAWFSDLRQIQNAVQAFAKMSAELIEKNEMLLALSDQDPLTKVGNRRSFDAALEAEFDAAHARNAPLSLLLLDLDHFKLVNDTYGHQMGDACLRTVGSILMGLCHGSGYLPARYGGEEFAVILPAADRWAATAFAERLRSAIERFEVAVDQDTAIHLTASIGVADLAAIDPRRPLTLIEAADAALYDAKRNGRNQVRNYNRPAGMRQQRVGTVGHIC